jgi:single-strand DNA-binding protein
MINKTIHIGALGADPETRFTQAGKPVCSFRIACSEKWKGQDGQIQESTEWVPITAWDRLAELCQEYLTKGSKVYVEGKLKTTKWQAQDGSDRWKTEVVAREVKFLSPKGGSSSGSGGGDSYQNNGGGSPMGEDVPF